MNTRLIATDLDGTLLTSGLQVSARTRAALDAARAAGIEVVPVTARQPRGLGLIAAQAGFTGWALCGNGAHGVHLGTGETLFEAHVEVEAQRAIASALNERIGSLLFVSVRERGEVFAAQAGYADLAHFEDHKRHPHEMESLPLADVLAAPSLKLIVRHPTLTPDDLLREARALRVPGVAVTHSGAPFIEVLAAGVSKAWGLAQLCGHLGIRQAEVLAFGDAPNDAEMLAWAGRGVAMAHAHPDARSAADEVTLSNDEDGVAAVIETLPELSAR
ncbi:Cof-type HAD-IIB family hydrolase [Deinococcus radiotolerans]|uniref:Hydrolase n=1 Tax=Deinococcus radiotolerans TaxID=1309407 RepID=A0ABQ2FKW0_9DEIO|nr:HAD family hydrolase [Deinococcus radiotolerans]GGL01305.1 hydrolase [Deinococcus radiotolerans]